MPASSAPASETICTVRLGNGRLISCPAHPAPCTFASVTVDDAEIYRADVEQFNLEAITEFTRLADALAPGRPEDCQHPKPDQHDPGEWQECAVATADGTATIRFTPAPDEVTYLQVCDERGEELGYWATPQLERAPMETLGAAIHALANSGRAQ